ncbi:MAG TPA: UvrB/UvrC motif-containing protein [Candidatus Paceibacterota bacterium]
MLSIAKVKKLPDTPGVYFFTRGREILYIGKATSLRDRARSYFSSATVERSRGGRIVQMLALVTGLRYKRTDSVLEALLLESELIKKHQPKYNAREKDDKSYWYVVITKEDWARVLMIRGQRLKAITYKLEAVFGPFPHGAELREALRLIRKIFPYRDQCQPLAGKPCFNAQIGLCPGVCLSADKAGLGHISPVVYHHQISHLKLLLSGRVKSLINMLTREMNTSARQSAFERSAELRDQIRALTHIQDIGLIKKSMSRVTLDMSNINFRIEAYDIAHLGGSNAVGVMVVVEAGELERSGYRKFKVSHGADDLANLREILERRLAHREWPKPNLIVVDGGPNQLATIKNILAKSKTSIPVVSVVKDERHQPKGLLGDQKMIAKYRNLILQLNHEAHRFAIAFHRRRRKKLTREYS